MRIPNSREDLLAELRAQAELLVAHCLQFDAGREIFAKPIAATLRTLLHDQGQNRALLAQVDMLHKLPWLDTAGHMVPGNYASTNNLTWMSFTVINEVGDTTPSWSPIFDDYSHRTFFNRPTSFGLSRVPNSGRRLAFDEWWQMPVIRRPGVFDYSRQYLVKELAQTDGGAHVDEGLRAEYYELTRVNSVGGVAQNSTGDVDMGSPIGAAVRQIAHEVLRSLPRRYSAGYSPTKESEGPETLITGITMMKGPPTKTPQLPTIVTVHDRTTR